VGLRNPVHHLQASGRKDGIVQVGGMCVCVGVYRVCVCVCVCVYTRVYIYMCVYMCTVEEGIVQVAQIHK